MIWHLPECILSQTPQPVPDFLTGGGGWTAAALLAGVLGWLLLRYLPTKDLQQEKLIETFSKQNQSERDAHDATIKAVTDAHLTQIKSERDQCRQDSLKLVDKFGTELQLQREVNERRHKETLDDMEKRHDENLRRHIEVLTDLKEQRHGIKDMQQSVVSHNELVDQIVGIRRKQQETGDMGSGDK